MEVDTQTFSMNAQGRHGALETDLALGCRMMELISSLGRSVDSLGERFKHVTEEMRGLRTGAENLLSTREKLAPPIRPTSMTRYGCSGGWWW